MKVYSKMSLILEKQTRSFRLFSMLFGISIFTSCFFSGCGEPNPVVELRTLGAIIDYDDDDKDVIVVVDDRSEVPQFDNGIRFATA